MPIETAILRDRDDAEVAVQAEIVRFGHAQRLMKGGAIALTGLIVGPMTLVVPGLHFVTTWLLPILGVSIGYYVYSIEMTIGKVSGECSNCKKAFEIEGGRLERPMWLRCPHCAHPLEFIPADLT